MNKPVKKGTIKMRRRRSALEAAARRMGYPTWSQFESTVIGAVIPMPFTPQEDDRHVRKHLANVLGDVIDNLKLGYADAKDINQILQDNPRQERRGGK